MRTQLELSETAKTINHTTETHVFADLADENTSFNIAQGKPTIQGDLDSSTNGYKNLIVKP